MLTSRARKDLARVPRHIANKLDVWIDSVERQGLEMVRKLPGFHDEPLKGARAGQRSIRLNIAWRAIYEVLPDGAVSFVSVTEVTHHAY
jgi:proteic killer suppression protein